SYCHGHHRELHSFPTRRSSDLRHRASAAAETAGQRPAGAHSSGGRSLVTLCGMPPPRLRALALHELETEGAFRRVLVVRPAHERSEEHTSELQSRSDLVCRLLL